jgi:hypothetical protein
MEDHETRRKVIRQWMYKRHSTKQAAEFAKKTVEQNEFQASRRDP